MKNENILKSIIFNIHNIIELINYSLCPDLFEKF